MGKLGWVLAAGSALASVPAAAQWHQATSKHFIIYGDMPAEEMKAYATKLETFDAAARLIRSMKDPEVGDGNRVQVFVTPSMLEVNRLFGGNAESGILGYYVGNVEGPYIVTPRKIRMMGQNLKKTPPENVFFHEYTHHLQLQNTNKPMPAWLSEGFAEFLSEPRFEEDGSIGLGTPVTDRAEQLYKYPWAPLGDLLEGNAYTLSYNDFWHQNYAQGWLLNHYLIFEKSRKGQIETYVRGIEKGQNPRDAAIAAFGDIGQLERELLEYKKAKRWPYVKINSAKLKIAPVTVTQLAPGAAEAMPYRVHAKTGFRALGPDAAVAKMRAIAARFPNDPLVMRTLAEVEERADHHEEAEKAADAALKLEPKSTEALILKGRAVFSRAKDANDSTLYKQARGSFLAANKLDPEDPEPLYMYFRSFVDANEAAPASALEAAKYAVVLAPRDYGIAEEVTYELIRQNKLAEAASTIKPIAYMPHYGQGRQNSALRVLALIEKGKREEAEKLAKKEFMDGEGS